MRPISRSSGTMGAALAALVALGASGQDRIASEEEARRVIEERSRIMKSMGQSMRTLKRFTQGRGSADEALSAVSVIEDLAPTIPSLFPAGSGLSTLPESEARDAIWEQWGDFVAEAERFGEKAEVLGAAISSGDPDRIGTAYGDLGKNGCGGCHHRFREKRNS